MPRTISQTLERTAVRFPKALACALLGSFAIGASSSSSMHAMGKPGLTPIPCPEQSWQPGDPAFEALPNAKAFFGQYDGGLYRIEIPEKWNGELVLFAHGFVTNAGPNGSALRVGTHRNRGPAGPD